MHRDQIVLFLSVPLSVLGGMASLWLTFELVEIAGAELLAVTFGGFSAFMFVAAILLAIVSVAELVRSE